MKLPLINIPLMIAFLCVPSFAQEVQTPPASTVADLPESPLTAPTSQPAPVKEKPDFEIESTQVKLIEVVEAPPMAGLPPVEGTMKLTVHSVADPRIPDPTPPVTQAQNPSAEEFPPEFLDSTQESHFASISATVYDNSRTLLTCNSNAGAGSEVTVWSNINFNHFSGIGNVEAKGADGKVRNYNLMMSIGNDTTDKLNKSGAPAIPVMPNGAPAFVIQTEQPNAATLTLIEDLHALYRTEGTRMAEAAAARVKAEDEKRAYLIANPPKPKDITVHFWNREHSATQTEGVQP